ncbi:diamine N-acetyltransferase [Amphibacillus marinus]|uniref:Diamine N-acetyltransferase n=1 Tax=Amphibacillus marinus TaxID=872970 RepID=A0A1H8I0A0_9BACI|nr:GNAT family N-acetyltransferase [Amphibacillus marinus]SEN61641.1 diamine N-acetyltransferase [Amphibacillus marinus]
MIFLEKVTDDNIDELIALKVAENQIKFIATTNLRCLADAYVFNQDGIPTTTFAIYADKIVVGFVMYIYDTLDHESFRSEIFYGKKCYFIWHFMIDKRYQGLGYGNLSFKKILLNIENCSNREAEYVALFYAKNNSKAERLCTSFGFDTTTITQENSRFAIKKLDWK